MMQPRESKINNFSISGDNVTVRYILASRGFRKNGREALRIKILYPKFFAEELPKGIRVLEDKINRFVCSIDASNFEVHGGAYLEIIMISFIVSDVKQDKIALTVEKREDKKTESRLFTYSITKERFI